MERLLCQHSGVEEATGGWVAQIQQHWLRCLGLMPLPSSSLDPLPAAALASPHHGQRSLVAVGHLSHALARSTFPCPVPTPLGTCRECQDLFNSGSEPAKEDSLG